MARAGLREELAFPGFEDVAAGIVNWPMSVIRLDSPDPARIVELADTILRAWRDYSDPSVGVLAYSGTTPHNTITPSRAAVMDSTSSIWCCATIAPPRNSP